MNRFTNHVTSLTVTSSVVSPWSDEDLFCKFIFRKPLERSEKRNDGRGGGNKEEEN